MLVELENRLQFHRRYAEILKIRNLVDQPCVSAALRQIDTRTGIFGETGDVHFDSDFAMYLLEDRSMN